MENYVPINCGLYDYLEAAATLQRQVPILFGEEGTTKSITAKVKDLYIRNKVEYLLTADLVEIRLDQITSFDGHDFTNPERCSL